MANRQRFAAAAAISAAVSIVTWGAASRPKDAIPLAEAQRAVSGNWIEAYKRFVGSVPGTE